MKKGDLISIPWFDSAERVETVPDDAARLRVLDRERKRESAVRQLKSHPLRHRMEPGLGAFGADQAALIGVPVDPQAKKVQSWRCAKVVSVRSSKTGVPLWAKVELENGGSLELNSAQLRQVR